jgi:putative peptidoglycan lipid II flippase
MSVMELSLIIDQRFASYLAVGSVTLIKYTSRFMGIPLGVFAVAFSTILLPHFARVHITDPKRLHFYLAESMKFVFWVTIPATLIMGYLSENIFVTLFVSSSKKFPTALIPEAGFLLMTFLAGLFFFSINKILFNLYYSFHDTRYPMAIAIVATTLNVIANYAFVGPFGTIGLALGTCVSGITQTVLSLFFLKYRHGFTLSLKEFFDFALRYSVQLMAVLIPFYWIYKVVYQGVVRACGNSTKAAFFFIGSFGFWIWVAPLIIAAFGALYLTRKQFKVQLYFLD